jgi:hypothetical protein
MSQLVTEMMKINFIFKATHFPISALVKWILSTSLSIHTLSLGIQGDKLNSLLNEIGCLEKLTELTVQSYDSSPDRGNNSLF